VPVKSFHGTGVMKLSLIFLSKNTSKKPVSNYVVSARKSLNEPLSRIVEEK